MSEGFFEDRRPTTAHPERSPCTIGLTPTAAARERRDIARRSGRTSIRVGRNTLLVLRSRHPTLIIPA